MSTPFENADEVGRLKREVHVAQRIAELLGDELVDKTLNGMLHGLQNQWMDCANSAERESLWLRAQGLKEFLNTLSSLIDSGKMAAIQLETMQNGNQESTES